MIEKDLSQIENVVLVSPVKISPKLLKKHLRERAKLVFAPESLDVFPNSKSPMIAKLLEMHKLGAEPNQCVLLVEYENRRAVIDTMAAWQNWGGVALCAIDGIEKTLAYLEEHLLSGNVPLEGKWLWETK